MLTRQLDSQLHKKRTYRDKNTIINTWTKCEKKEEKNSHSITTHWITTHSITTHSITSL